MLNEVKQG